MKPYELTYIVSSQVAAEQSDTIKKDIESFIQEKGGVIIKSEKKAPQILAYPIKKNSSGYVITMEFQMGEDKVQELKNKLGKEPNVLRHITMVKKPMKEMKERKTRKPALMPKESSDISEVFKEKPKKEEKPVALQDIDKKLDEILSE